MTKVGSKKERLEDLMRQIYDVHSQYTLVWTKAKNSVVGNAEIGTPAYYAANHHAYAAAAPETARLKELLKELFWTEMGEVEKKFIVGDAAAVNTIIDFLEIDIPAFHCGYAKEWYFRKLKTLHLKSHHISRLKSLALAMCRTSSFRREFKDLTRLMIKLADAEFVEELRSISKSSSERVRLKSTRMLERILGNRLDLRPIGIQRM